MTRGKRTKITGSVGTRGVLGVACVCVLLAGLLATHAWTRVQGTLVGYSLSEAQGEQAELLREQKALNLELATRRAAVRIESDARTRLGMVEPDPARIIPLKNEPEKAPALVQAQR